MSTSAAYDLESKFSEAALGAVQLADYRNFAHGRHHWISKKSSGTCIIAMISPSEESIALKTLALLPVETPIIRITTKNDNAVGLLELFAQVFHYTLLVGSQNKIDPGRPHIPDYGRKLYHISYNLWAPHRSNPYKSLAKRAAYRKCGTNETSFIQYEQAFQDFVAIISKKSFGGIIFDYDGTLKNTTDKQLPISLCQKLSLLLKNNITIGIATGRGKSVRIELREALPPEYWNKVVIAYYNGGEVETLDNDFAPNVSSSPHPELEIVMEEIVHSLPNMVSAELRPTQLTVFKNQSTPGAVDYQAVIHEICSKYSNIKIWKSGHSIDVVAKESSKLNILKYFANDDVITVGDSGRYGGNDFELLSHEFGLSVDNVSWSFKTCWNCAPLGVKGPDATQYYLDKINITKGKFTIKLD